MFVMNRIMLMVVVLCSPVYEGCFKTHYVWLGVKIDLVCIYRPYTCYRVQEAWLRIVSSVCSCARLSDFTSIFISAHILNTFVKYLLEYNLFILDIPAKHLLCFITRNRNLSLCSKWDQVKNDSEREKCQNEIVVHSCWFFIYCWFSETYRNPVKE